MRKLVWKNETRFSSRDSCLTVGEMTFTSLFRNESDCSMVHGQEGIIWQTSKIYILMLVEGAILGMDDLRDACYISRSAKSYSANVTRSNLPNHA